MKAVVQVLLYLLAAIETQHDFIEKVPQPIPSAVTVIVREEWTGESNNFAEVRKRSDCSSEILTNTSILHKVFNLEFLK